jgi:protein-S-isoprenylcysteine O-methyltransferase Ste14
MSRAVPLGRWFLSSSVLAGMLFLCAGRLRLPMLNAYLAAFAGMGLAAVLVADPSQDGERRGPGPAAIDPVSRRLASLLFISTIALAALDAGRFHWTEAVSARAQIVALAVLISAAGLQVWAMAVNPFFSTAIRIQPERGHEVVTRGPYRLVRHPGYLAMAVIMPATAVAIGSAAAIIPGSCYSGLILWRTAREDEFLVGQLAGYAEYTARVRYRLIPLFW